MRSLEELQGDELPLQTTGLEHIGMVVPDVVPAARFYSSLFNPDMQKEKDAPLRYYVMTGTGYIAIGAARRRDGVEGRSLLHAGSRLQPRPHERDAREEGSNRRWRAESCRIRMRSDCSSSRVPGGPGPTAVPGGRHRRSRSRS